LLTSIFILLELIRLRKKIISKKLQAEKSEEKRKSEQSFLLDDTAFQKANFLNLKALFFVKYV